MELITFLDLCSGIGGGRLGLERVGMKSIGYSDTSRLSVTTYKLLFDTDGEQNYGNLKKIKTEKLPRYDVLIAGFPCQTFSVIGRRDGFGDIRGQIIFHLARILQETQPKAFILENVKGLVTHDKGKTIATIVKLLNDAGYDVVYKVLTSLDYGVPQMRQRVYFIGINRKLGLSIDDFQWPDKKPVPPLSDYLIDEQSIPEWMEDYLPGYLDNDANGGKFSMSDLLAMDGKVLDTRMSDLRIYDGKVPTLRSQRDGVLYVKDGHLYSLTGHEALLLQGFPKEYADKVYGVVSNRHLLMQAGNAMTVNVIEALGGKLKELFSKKQIKHIDMDSYDFENCCADYLKRKYSDTGCTFELNGGSDSTASDIVVKKNGKQVCSIEIKEPVAQCGQFVAFADEEAKKFIYSELNHPKEPSKQSLAILDAMSVNFDKHKTPSTRELGLEKQLYYDRIIDYYENHKQSKFFMTREKVDSGEFIIFPTSQFKDYFDVKASYRKKRSGSHNPNKKELALLPNLLNKKIVNGYRVQKDGKYTNVLMDGNCPQRLILGDEDRVQFKNIGGNLYRMTGLGKTNNPNVIFSISLKSKQKDDDLSAFEKMLQSD